MISPKNTPKVWSTGVVFFAPWLGKLKCPCKFFLGAFFTATCHVRLVMFIIMISFCLANLLAHLAQDDNLLPFFAAVVKNTCSRPGWVCTRRRSGHKVLSTTCIKHRQHIGRLWISKIVPAECMKGWWRIIWACAVNAQSVSYILFWMLPHLCAFGMASLIMNTLNYHLQASAAMNPEESWYRDILLREQIMSDNLRY